MLLLRLWSQHCHFHVGLNELWGVFVFSCRSSSPSTCEGLRPSARASWLFGGLTWSQTPMTMRYSSAAPPHVWSNWCQGQALRLVWRTLQEYCHDAADEMIRGQLVIIRNTGERKHFSHRCEGAAEQTGSQTDEKLNVHSFCPTKSTLELQQYVYYFVDGIFRYNAFDNCIVWGTFQAKMAKTIWMQLLGFQCFLFLNWIFFSSKLLVERNGCYLGLWDI